MAPAVPNASRCSFTFNAVDLKSTALGLGHLKVLATKSTPPELRAEVIEMSKKGETPTVHEIEAMKKRAVGDTRPTPTEAKAQAKATGEVVEGSDNKLYTPMPEDQIEVLIAFPVSRQLPLRLPPLRLPPLRLPPLRLPPLRSAVVRAQA